MSARTRPRYRAGSAAGEVRGVLAATGMDEGNMAYSACIRCQTCDGFPCLVHAKADAEIAAVRPALEFPNVTLLRNAKALKLQTNAGGTAVSEVVVEVEREMEVFRGDIVVVSCGAANTAKLLLMSANDKHPNGLANGSGQVGRNYMFHNSQAVLALSLEHKSRTAERLQPSLNPVYLAACACRGESGVTTI